MPLPRSFSLSSLLLSSLSFSLSSLLSSLIFLFLSPLRSSSLSLSPLYSSNSCMHARQVVQDLRPCIGLKFFDFCKHFHFNGEDDIEKVKNLTEKEVSCPLPCVQNRIYLSINISLVPFFYIRIFSTLLYIDKDRTLFYIEKEKY